MQSTRGSKELMLRLAWLHHSIESYSSLEIFWIAVDNTGVISSAWPSLRVQKGFSASGARCTDTHMGSSEHHNIAERRNSSHQHFRVLQGLAGDRIRDRTRGRLEDGDDGSEDNVSS